MSSRYVILRVIEASRLLLLAKPRHALMVGVSSSDSQSVIINGLPPISTRMVGVVMCDAL